MLKFVVYEDHPPALEKAVSAVHRAMASYDFEYKILKYNGYNESINEVINDTSEPKIYILDIEVPRNSGIDIGSMVRFKDWKSIIIFVTAHTECRHDVFYSRLLALDYISKFNDYVERLQQTLEKAISILNKSRVLSFKFDHVAYRVDFDSILYIKKVKESKKCIIYTTMGKNLPIAGGIKEIFCLLDRSFKFSDNSCIVNMDQVESVNTANKMITFKNNISIPNLSKRNKKEFEEAFLNYR